MNNNTTARFLIHWRQFSSKPSDNEVRLIQFDFKSSPDCVELTDEQLAWTLVHGSTIKVANLSGASNQDFLSSQLIGIDFDCDCCSLDDILDKLEKDSISPNFVYETFSHCSEWKKYRAIWYLDAPIYNPREYKQLVDLMILYFGSSPNCKLKPSSNAQFKFEDGLEYCSNGRRGNQRKWFRCYTTDAGKPYYIGQSTVADKACSDVSRLFFGSSGDLPYVNWGVTVQADFLRTVALREIKSQDPAHFNRVSSVPVGENQDPLILYIKENQISPTGTGSLKSTIDFPQTISISELSASCRLFADSLESELHNQETFGLITNLQYFSKNTIQNHIKAVRRFDTKKDWIDTYKRQYSPQDCIKYCPYASSCNPTGKLITKSFSDSPKSTLPSKIGKHNLDPLELSRQVLKSKISKILSDENSKGKIHIIKADCGLGKTQAYLDIINQELMDNVTIALPTHKLKAEVENRNANILHCVKPRLITPELPDIPEKHIVNHLYSIGAWSLAKQILSKYPDGRKYLIDKSRSLKGLLLTTHDKVLINPTYNPILIIDEDILSKMIQVKELNLNDLRNFEDYYSVDFGIKSTNNIHKHTKHNPKPFLKQYLSYVNLHEPTTNVLDFLSNAEYYTNQLDYKSGKAQSNHKLIYVTYKPLPMNKTIIILSATIEPDFYRALYGDRVQVHYCPNVNPTANIIQHNKYSFSKSTVLSSKTKHKALIEQLTQGTNPVLTYLELTNLLNANRDFEVPYLGNLEGYDTLNDKSFTILGKAVLPLGACQLISKVLFPKHTFSTEQRTKQTIKYNGKIKPRYFTYQDDKLRQVDLWFTGASLTQAIGRIRPLTSNNTITIYNDFPI